VFVSFLVGDDAGALTGVLGRTGSISILLVPSDPLIDV